MRKNIHVLEKLTFSFAILSAILLLFIMLTIPVYKEQIFYERQTLAIVEIVIIIGFVFILFFDILSLFWISSRIRRNGKFTIGKIVTFILGVFCLIMLIGEKVMLDEIGRELILGWETKGEWIILYTLFVTQMIYNLVIFFKLKCLNHYAETI